MKNRALAFLPVIVGSLAISGPVFAHHGAARWNTDEWATISGQVKEFDWQNPHPLLHITSCAPFGIPRLLNTVAPFEILQTPGRVIMLFEGGNSLRQIWTDGRGHPADLDSTWMGHSIGQWDEDTLVVDTIGLNDKTWLDTAGHPHSDALHIVERIRRVDHDTLEDDLTFDDTKTYTKPWTSKIIYKLHPDWLIREDIACEDRILMDLKARRTKIYPYQQYPMIFPIEEIPRPTIPASH